ncbi:hypothetical protein GobsT_63830 [Gemmata obscuriglobus]|uniref:Uncharacterized protein n=1 Tax=Gemmata obscuriglobus TaxID=114 RepID=A0A2Z3GWW7_9BACT|nr:hypothetical protein [Gemmata obscuriglobus]AWM35886.1 hypothetical protein C1280_01900 [Gemmata obscuriglobus]QEG31561.1 hypothetical protein GobsT_63830 [Gemmata obscuriglobus]VTS10903.1 unnamed protein product [Gemmata obscuriglobus UQM 2246]
MSIYQRSFGIVPLFAGIALIAYTINTKFVAPDPDDPMPWSIFIFLCFVSLSLSGWGLAWLQGERLSKPDDANGDRVPDTSAGGSRLPSGEADGRAPKPWQK